MRGRRVVGAVGAALALAAFAFAAVLTLTSAAQAETVQSSGIRIEFGGGLAPRELPRSAPAPLRLSLTAKIAGADGQPLPRLRTLAIGVNRVGRLDPTGLPLCRLGQIQPASTAAALAACGDSQVGSGRFAARVALSEQAPYPSRGRIIAFNGRFHGRPAIFLHVYGRDPIPTSYTLPLTISHQPGTFGTVLRTSIAAETPSAGRITELSLDLGRSFTYRGQRRSYLTGVCPAPPALGSTRLPVFQMGLGFADRNLAFTVDRGCVVSGA
jgi:hypothetical protein